jgi:hypothetical protein
MLVETTQIVDLQVLLGTLRALWWTRTADLLTMERLSALRHRDRYATGRMGRTRAPRHRPRRPRRLREPLLQQGQAHPSEDEASIRPVPLQARALVALDELPPGSPGDLLFPAEHGAYLDLHIL